MKKCPTCEKTFDDALKFCQTDGTPLVEITENTIDDPYKTIVAGKDEISSSIPPPDMFKTMVASPPFKPDDDEVLEIPEKPAFLREIENAPKNLSSDKGSDKIEKPIDIPASAPLDIFTSKDESN